MFTGRRTTEAVIGQEELERGLAGLTEGHAGITRHWIVIWADGVTTDVELASHVQLLTGQRERLAVQTARSAQQTWLLMAIDVWDKWGTRLKRRGLDGQAMRALQRDQMDLERLRPRQEVLFDPYGAMAAD